MGPHAALSSGLSCDAPRAGDGCAIGGGALADHVEFDFARQLDDGFGMMAVLEQRVFDGLRAVDEQAAIESVLFLGDPVAAAIPANKDDGRLRVARWRFDELHVGISFCGRAARSQSHRLSVAVLLAARMFGWFRLGDRVTHAPNIFPAGYEFEGDGVTIS
jgi:hypothetical protein